MGKKCISYSECSLLCKGIVVAVLPLYTPICTLPRQIAVIHLIGNVEKLKLTGIKLWSAGQWAGTPAYRHQAVVKEITTLSKDTEQLMFQRCFWKEFLKARWGRGAAGCMISSCTVLWLVDGEVTGCCHRCLTLSIFGSSQPRGQ